MYMVSLLTVEYYETKGGKVASRVLPTHRGSRLTCVFLPHVALRAQLSAHQIATHLELGGRLGPPGWYDGGLLSLAYELGKRLMPAFDTPLGIPVHRVNLRKGVPRGVWTVLYLIATVYV